MLQRIMLHSGRSVAALFVHYCYCVGFYGGTDNNIAVLQEIEPLLIGS
jgi:hypothetical protein